MSANEKLSSLNDRAGELKRELTDLAAVKPQSDNAALVDLESALIRELERVEGQVKQIQTYIDRCTPQTSASE